MKQFMQRAYELVAKGWVQGQLYTGWVRSDDEDEEEENKALLPRNRANIEHVCSVGAMRLAFAELVGVPIHQTTTTYERYNRETDEYEDYQVISEWVDEEELARHPFYQEGMKILGRAFYQADQLSATREYALSEPEKLLDGDDGRPYTVLDVSHSIIGLNDAAVDEVDMLGQAIVAAFKEAVELAPETLTYESEGDWYLTTANENGGEGVPA